MSEFISIKDFIEIKKEFQNSWLKFAKLVFDIKDNKIYKQYGFKSFSKFVATHLPYLRQTVYKMVRGYIFIKDNYPELLSSDKDRYIPSYTYIHYIFSKKLNDKQKKVIEKMVFSGATKKEILKTRRQFIAGNETKDEKLEKAVTKTFSFAKSLKKSLFNLRNLPYLNLFAYQKVEKTLKKVEKFIQNELYDLEDTVLG